MIRLTTLFLIDKSLGSLPLCFSPSRTQDPGLCFASSTRSPCERDGGLAHFLRGPAFVFLRARHGRTNERGKVSTFAVSTRIRIAISGGKMKSR